MEMQVKEKEKIRVFPMFKERFVCVFVKDDGVYQIIIWHLGSIETF